MLKKPVLLKGTDLYPCRKRRIISRALQAAEKTHRLEGARLQPRHNHHISNVALATEGDFPRHQRFFRSLFSPGPSSPQNRTFTPDSLRRI
jgi:hypothetical protein